jgi:hypothetical protein
MPAAGRRTQAALALEDASSHPTADTGSRRSRTPRTLASSSTLQVQPLADAHRSQTHVWTQARIGADAGDARGGTGGSLAAAADAATRCNPRRRDRRRRRDDARTPATARAPGRRFGHSWREGRGSRVRRDGDGGFARCARCGARLDAAGREGRRDKTPETARGTPHRGVPQARLRRILSV